MGKKKQKKSKQILNPNVDKRRHSTIRGMNREIINICEELTVPSNKFKCKDVDQHISDYIQEYNRLLYSVISEYIFQLSEEKTDAFNSNLETLVEYTLNKQDKLHIEKEECCQQDRTKQSILKLWDHVNLAINQSRNLKQSDEEFKKKFTDHIVPVRKDVDDQLNEFTRSMNSQLISLIGIFTAMSFLVFGGINSLDNIFSGAFSIPLLKLMIIGCIWGLCIINLVFIFMFFISKMVSLNITSNTSPSANIFQKYPLVWWSNLVIGALLIISTWLFYIDKMDLGGWFVALNRNYAGITVIIGFVVIIGIFSMAAWGLFKSINAQIAIPKEQENSQPEKIIGNNKNKRANKNKLLLKTSGKSSKISM